MSLKVPRLLGPTMGIHTLHVRTEANYGQELTLTSVGYRVSLKAAAAPLMPALFYNMGTSGASLSCSCVLVRSGCVS